jgi:hypothetical protein
MRYEFVEALCYSSTCLNDVICVCLRIYWCLTRLDYLSSMTRCLIRGRNCCTPTTFLMWSYCVFLRSELRVVMSVTISAYKCSVHLYLLLFVGWLMSEFTLFVFACV